MQRNPQMQDDLKFASEAITQIALQAMKSIQELYSSRSPQSYEPPKEVIKEIIKEEPKEVFNDARFTLMEPITTSKEPIRSVKSVEMEVNQDTPKDISSRPPKYDDNFNNLLL